LRWNAEPWSFRGQRIELAVAMPRDQHLAAMPIFSDERRHEVLPVPERQNDWHLRLDDFIDIGRIETELVGQPDQPQEFSRQKSGDMLKPVRSQHVAKHFFQRVGFAS
jgi:hypothetical protein